MKGRGVINVTTEGGIFRRKDSALSLSCNLYISNANATTERNKQKRRVNNGEHRTLSRMIVIVPAAGTYRSKYAPAPIFVRRRRFLHNASF